MCNCLEILQCAVYGMQPVCEHRNYCRNDPKAMYIGQDHHISHPSHRNNNKYFPSGWGAIKDNFKGLCFYAAKVQGGGNALCNRPINSHSWQGPGYNPGFMCARGAVTIGSLLGKNGVRVQPTDCQVARLVKLAAAINIFITDVHSDVGQVQRVHVRSGVAHLAQQQL